MAVAFRPRSSYVVASDFSPPPDRPRPFSSQVTTQKKTLLSPMMICGQGLLHDDRMMERSGIPRLRSDCSPERGNLEWFDDHRVLPEHNAGYLRKLTELRTELIHQEAANLTNALERFRSQHFQQERSQMKVLKRNASDGITRESFPERHRKLQIQRKQDIERHRRAKTPPQLDTLKGERLMDTPKGEGEWEVDSRGDGKGRVGARAAQPEAMELVSQLRPRIPPNPANNLALAAQLALPVTSSIKPTSSIPNIGRKALRSPDKFMPGGAATNRHPVPTRRSDSFIRQMSLHNKDQRGLYKGKFGGRHLLRADTDEVDLTPESFRFDISDLPYGDNDPHRGVAEANKLVNVASSSPVSWSYEGTAFSDRSERGTNGVSRGGAPIRFMQNGEVSWYKLPGANTGQPYMKVNENHAAQLQQGKGYNLRTMKHGGHLYQSPKKGQVKLEAQSMSVESENLQAVGNNSDLGNHNKAGNGDVSNEDCAGCLMCQNPDLVAMPMLDGQYLLVKKDTLPSFNKSVTMDTDNSVENAAPPTTPNMVSHLTPHRHMDHVSKESTKKQLVVEMPNLVFQAPTPVDHLLSPREAGVDHQGTLQRTMRQNELREKEINNLMADIHELNDVTDKMHERGPSEG